MLLKNWEMAQDKSPWIKKMLTLNQKQQQIWKGHLCSFISDPSGFYSLLCTWHGTTPEFKHKSVGRSGLFSHKFSGNTRTNIIRALILPQWAAAHPDLACCVRTSYMSTSTSTTLPPIISSKPRWRLNLRQSVVGWSHADAHLARPRWWASPVTGLFSRGLRLFLSVS